MRWILEPGEVSGRGAIVMPQQAAEETPAADSTNVRGIGACRFFRWTCCCGGHCPVAQPLVWAVLVEEANVSLAGVIEMAEAEAQEVVQAFALERTDPSFREGVCLRRGMHPIRPMRS